MELVVLNTSGKETGRKVTLDETVFGIEPNQHAVYLEVKQYLAAQRQGTHKAKERSEITEILINSASHIFLWHKGRSSVHFLLLENQT